MHLPTRLVWLGRCAFSGSVHDRLSQNVWYRPDAWPQSVVASERVAAMSLRIPAALATIAFATTVGFAGTAHAAPTTPPVGTPSPSASCIGTLTAYLAHYDQFGNPQHGVGSVISPDAPGGLVGVFNREVSKIHGGSIDGCIQ